MEEGSSFERDGRRYEVLQDGLDFKQEQKSCILPKGESRSITIEKALKQGLVREVVRATDSTSGETDDQLPLSCPDQRDQRDASSQANIRGSGDTRHAPTRPSCVCEDTFSMPVDQIRAQVFLAHGLIYPAEYDKAAVSSAFDDIQESAPTELTLFATPRRIKKHQLLLRVLLHPDEVADSGYTADVVRLPMPLPISRLAGIEVSPEVGDLNRYVDGWVKPDVPVPRHMFTVTQGGSTEMSENGLKESPPRGGRQIADVEDSIRKFDRYMGLIAFLRNAARYFSATTGCYADYPEAFFSLCSAILRDPEVRRSQELGPDPLLMALLDQETRLTVPAKAVLTLATGLDAYIEKDRARSFAMEIFRAAGENEDLGYAFKTLFSGDYRSAIRALQLSKFPVEAGLLAALFKFSGRQSNDHRAVKQRLHEDWTNPDQVVPVLGALGAYYGYTTLDAKETSLHSVHPLLKPFVEERPEIKFHLHTMFERQIIEAMYQWAFYRRSPDKGSEALYARLPANSTSLTTAGPRSVLVHDHSYRVRDLIVRRYEVTMLGRIVQRIKDMKGDVVDERSEVGKSLLSHCFFLADEFELSRKGGRDTIRYRISKSRLVDLLVQGQISVNARVLETAMDEDSKVSGT